MRESVLRDYFLGVVDAVGLREDLADSVVRTSHDVLTHYITDDIGADFEINASHLISLCDAFLIGTLTGDHLELIGFALEVSEHFVWDDENFDAEESPVAETVHAWASPEINYPLTNEIITKFKHLLSTGESLFTREDVPKQAKKRVVSPKATNIKA